MHKTFSPSTYNTYIPGTGITITRANILDEIARRDEAPTAEAIVMSLVTPIERITPDFPHSKRFKKLVNRVGQIMNTTHTRRAKRR